MHNASVQSVVVWQNRGILEQASATVSERYAPTDYTENQCKEPAIDLLNYMSVDRPLYTICREGFAIIAR